MGENFFFLDVKVVIPSTGCREKIWFFRPPMMSFAFLDMIFGGKGLQIDTYKPPKCIWSYHTHMVNTS